MSQPIIQQNFENKEVTQIICEEVVEFSYEDFEDLKSNPYYERVYLGKLFLTTGKIVCTDPLYRALGFPQAWQAPIGKYEVYLYIGLEEDFKGTVAYAEIVFKDEYSTR